MRKKKLEIILKMLIKFNDRKLNIRSLPHGKEFKDIYYILRETFVNPLIPNQEYMKKLFNEEKYNAYLQELKTS